MDRAERHSVLIFGILLGVLWSHSTPMAIANSQFVFGALTRGHAMHQVAIGFDGNATPLGLSVKDQFVTVKGFAAQDQEGWTYNASTGEAETGADAVGSYDVHYRMTAVMVAGSAAIYEACVFQNGTPLVQCMAPEGFGAGLPDVETLVGLCHIHANLGDKITLRVTNRTNGQDLTITSAHLTAHRM